MAFVSINTNVLHAIIYFSFFFKFRTSFPSSSRAHLHHQQSLRVSLLSLVSLLVGWVEKKNRKWGFHTS